jgi:hypothetical protein
MTKQKTILITIIIIIIIVVIAASVVGLLTLLRFRALSLHPSVPKETITEISVSPGPIIGSHPKLSHDGEKIVYRRYKSGDDGLWVVNTDGTGLKKLTSEVPAGEGTFDFAWSPDDKFTFYVFYGPVLPVPDQPQVKPIQGREPRPESLTAELKIINVNTGDTRVLFKAEGVDREFSIKSPVWLAQGEIAFILRNEFNKADVSVKVVDVETGQIVEPAAKTTLYFWQTKGSPEESVIASIDTAGVIKELTPGGALSVPSVAPRATKIAYSNQEGIVVMNNDGSDARVMLSNLGGGAVPLFSPDGQKLVYSRSKDDGHRILESDIYMINVDGSDEERLTDSGEKLATEPSWSPDGKKIVFFYLGQTDKQIAVLDVGASFVIEPGHQTGKPGEKLIYDLKIKNNDLVGEQPRDFMITGKSPLVPPEGWTIEDCYKDMTPCMWKFEYYIYGAKRYPDGERRSNFTLDPQENPIVKMHVTSKKSWPAGEYLHYQELHYGDPGGLNNYAYLVEKPFVYELTSGAKWLPQGCTFQENIINCPLYEISKP